MEKENPRIGIVGWKVGDNSFGCTVPYMNLFSHFGDVEIITPTKRVRKLDLLVLPGGADINPSRYKAVPSWFTGSPNPFLEFFDLYMLQKYIDAKIPIFGICRGLQTLNVHFGGTLDQHIDTKTSETRSELVHDAFQLKHIVPGEQSSVTKFRVNSLHHQAIGRLGDDLEIMLTDKLPTKNNDFIVEGIRHKSLPIYGVQYHPEEIYDEYSLKVIQYLISLSPNLEKNVKTS